MASNKTTTADSVLSGLSGQALARARRAALSQGGKAGLGQVKAVSSAQSQARIRPAKNNMGSPVASVSMPALASIAPVGLPESEANDGAVAAERDHAIEEICSIVASEPGALKGSVGSAVRQFCQQRRQALSSKGKSAVKSFRMITPALGSGLSGRAAARTRRAALCENGRGDDPACRPSGRVRPESSSKVQFGTTLSGTAVSGTMVERNGKITGVEAGTCRSITGTEYIGAEQYSSLCASVPAAGRAKVVVSATSRGQRVSGVDAARGDKVTGTELDANKAVTGNEYLSVDKFEAAAKTRPAPAKVGISTTRSGMGVSGTEVGRSNKVTGDERGSCNSISGIQYSGSEQFVSFCDATQQAASRALMGGRGASAGLDISGTKVGRSSNVTGDERGSCKSISGIQYSGSGQFDSFCDSTQQAASRALMASRGARNVSGVSQSSKGTITGAEKGASMILSGTPYSTSRQRVSERGANTNPHPLTRGPANIQRESTVVQQMPTQQGSFSVVAPARMAQNGSANRISGTAYGSTGRITGPVNLAPGLVSGTPEFRYHDGAAPVMVPARAEQPQAESARNRISGDGREGGFAITGAAWRRNEKVSGTEGNSTHRNPTIRGNQRSTIPGAAQMKVIERAELPIGKVTGSSGTDMKGSSITYSGGARG